MTNWTLPDRCPAVDRQGRRCTQPIGHPFDHVAEGFDPAPPPKNNWLLIGAALALGVGAAWLFAQIIG